MISAVFAMLVLVLLKKLRLHAQAFGDEIVDQLSSAFHQSRLPLSVGVRFRSDR